MRPVQTKLIEAGRQLQGRGDPAYDLTDTAAKLARIGGQYWVARGQALKAQDERGESMHDLDVRLVQMQLLSGARQFPEVGDEETAIAMQQLAIELGAIRERMLERKLDRALQGTHGGWARRTAVTALEAERQKQLLGQVEGESSSELLSRAERTLRRR